MQAMAENTPKIAVFPSPYSDPQPAGILAGGEKKFSNASDSLSADSFPQDLPNPGSRSTSMDYNAGVDALFQGPTAPEVEGLLDGSIL